MCPETTYRTYGAETSTAIDMLLLWSRSMRFRRGVGFTSVSKHALGQTALQ